MATKTVTKQTGLVSGLKISRDGGSFKFEWKQPNPWYTDWQKAWWSDSTVYHTKNRWGTLRVAKGDEKRTSTWGTASYFPNTKKKLTYVGICLQGKTKNTTSSGTTTKYTASGYKYGWYYISAPKKPTVTAEAGEYPATTFTWSVPDSGATSKYWYTNCYIYTWLLKNSNETDGSKTDWKTNFTGASTTYSTGGTQSGTRYERILTGASGSFTITEDSSLLSDGNSYTRWFCICSRGPAGQSSYAYAKHVYGLPNQCSITNYSITPSMSAIGYTAQVWFDTPKSNQRPLDQVKVQYAIAVPDDGMACPDSASWQDGITVLASDQTSGATFSIDSLIGEDQCLFIRANAIYDKRTSYGVPAMVDVGRLKAPDNLSVTTNPSNHKATITASNQSSVPDSFLAVRYMTPEDPIGMDIAIIPHGETTKTVQCPAWTSSPTFGVYAVAPGDCYSISTGYDIEISSSSTYSTSDIDLNEDVFYGQVGGKLGTFDFVYKEQYSYSVDVQSTAASIARDLYYLNNVVFYNAVSNQFGTYTFVYDETSESWIYSSSEIDLMDYGIILNVDYTPSDQDEIVITLSPVASWTLDGSMVELADYGIAIPGIVPVDDDKIIISLVELPDGVSKYEIDPVMTSRIITYGGTVPDAPEITAAPTSIQGTIRVTWNWSWDEADGAELSWSEHEDAWESTDEPNTYKVTTLNSSAWNISGLDTGIKWYIRVRLFKDSGNGETYGIYSKTAVVDLASAPLKPVLSLSPGVITEDGQVTASWVYSTTDGTQQAFAEVAEVVDSGYMPIAQTLTAQHVTIDAQDQGWNSGENHTLVCRVVSASGRQSDEWSNEVTVAVADPVTCEITQTSLESVTVYYVDDEEEEVGFTETALTEMPMTVTVEGAGEQGTTTLSIERAAAYHVDRPDESEFNGFEGETVYTITQTGEDQITINLSDLIGHLDDSASYNLIATVQDGLGQTASEEIGFSIRWSHQPDAPDAMIEIDNENLYAVLTPIAPTGAELTDVCDIYRLSVDKPELVYEGATFGEEYIDPYPTIGEHGGYRFVTRTINGDYITDGDDKGSFAWTDFEAGVDVDYNIIDFGSDTVRLAYDIDLDNSWEKGFKQTEYLGGSVQGDWSKAIKRSGSISGNAIVTDDDELIQAMRRLATHPGICHVRTKDGSSFSADVQVNEKYAQNTAHKIANFSLKITRVDPQIPDGLPYTEWSAE